MGEDCRIDVGRKEEEQKLMDTPERGKVGEISASVCNFEDSPVFNFLNSLSPIKPVKPVHITQSINPLSFASLPSVFTSPHLSSLKGSRLLRRHQISDPSKPEFSADVNHVDTCKVSVDAAKKLEDQQENLDPHAPCDEMASKPSPECSNPEKVDEKNPNCDNNSPRSFLIHDCDSEATLGAKYTSASSALVHDSEINPVEVNQTDLNKEATSCDWESLIFDDSNMLIFESPENTVSDKKLNDVDSNVFSDITNKMGIRHFPVPANSNVQVGEGSGIENLSTQPEEGSKVTEDAVMHGIITSSLVNYPNEHLSGLHRGMRRRCLVYEMSEVRSDHVDENSALHSSVLLQPDCNTYDNLQLAPTKSTNESSPCVLPGIGLHLNCLGSKSKDLRIFNQQASSSGGLLIGPNSYFNLTPATRSKELLNDTPDHFSSERENGTFEGSAPSVGDACQTSAYDADEGINHSSSLKKKRRKLEQSGGGESCKRCNCKKSRCLKLYCECFAAGVYCVDPCSCVDCFNKPIHEETVLSTRKQIESRNPLAFAPKVIRGTDSLIESREDLSNTPASARHKRGCNCKKSGCLKKYCECYQMGVGCSVNCRCEGCKNVFGRKDGTEVECEEDETNKTEKTSLLDKSAQITAVHNDHDQNMDFVSHATPLSTGRQPVEHLLSNKKPPSSFSPCIGSSATFYTNQRFGRPRFFQPQTKFDKQLETVNEDEIPGFLQERSPTSGIKSSSPNSHRVSPPVSGGKSPSLRSSRKLILQSIPAFPSLNSNQ